MHFTFFGRVFFCPPPAWIFASFARTWGAPVWYIGLSGAALRHRAPGGRTVGVSSICNRWNDLRIVRSYVYGRQLCSPTTMEARMNKRMYSLFENINGRWVRLDQYAYVKTSAVRIYQSRLLDGFFAGRKIELRVAK